MAISTITKAFLMGLSTCFLCLNAQKIEAESATLTAGASKQTDAGRSGGAYVSMQEGNLSFSVNISTAGFFNMFINGASSGGSKINFINIDGNTSDFTYTATQYSTLQVASFQKLTAGNHTIQIQKSWGWINIDYIELVAVDGSARFNINKAPVNPNATKETKCLYQFLYDNYNTKILSGVMTLNSMDESDWLKQNTGKEPVVLGIDFLQTNRGYNWYNDETPVNDAKAWYAKNGIPTMMWHWRDPSRKTNAFYTKNTTDHTDGTDFDITKINNTSSVEYAAMISDIDFVANQLKTLQTAKVPVLWRPLHEAAGGWFWWGAKGGASCKQLWRVMYDRMVNHHGLNNLIWVWTYEPSEDGTWYPGDEYVDMVGRDVYKTGDHGSQVIEFNNMNQRYGGKKMVTLSETGSFPDVDNLVKDGAAWSWYMPWYKDYTRVATYNSLDLWKKMFASDYVLTLDEMPNWIAKCNVTSVDEASLQNENETLSVFPSTVDHELTIKGQDAIESVKVYNLAGNVVRTHTAHAQETQVLFADLPSGLYFVKVNEQQTFKVFKK